MPWLVYQQQVEVREQREQQVRQRLPQAWYQWVQVEEVEQQGHLVKSSPASISEAHRLAILVSNGSRQFSVRRTGSAD